MLLIILLLSLLLVFYPRDVNWLLSFFNAYSSPFLIVVREGIGIILDILHLNFSKAEWKILFRLWLILLLPMVFYFCNSVFRLFVGTGNEIEQRTKVTDCF
jgi:hypothetical protein